MRVTVEDVSVRGRVMAGVAEAAVEVNVGAAAPGTRVRVRVGPTPRGSFGQVEAEVSDAVIAVPLRPGGVIEGRCVDASGRPVGGARVYASNDEGPFAFADTDAEGRFRVIGVAGTRAQLRADAPQVAGKPSVPSVSLPSVAVGATDLEIRFAPR